MRKRYRVIHNHVGNYFVVEKKVLGCLWLECDWVGDAIPFIAEAKYYSSFECADGAVQDFLKQTEVKKKKARTIVKEYLK